MQLRSFILWVVLSICLLLVVGNLTGCSQEEPDSIVDLNKRVHIDTLNPVSPSKPLTIGIGSIITPSEGYVYYRQLLEYIESKIGQPIKVLDSENYSEVNAMLSNGKLDAAFVCGGPYVEGKEEFGLKLLAAPQVDGLTVYHSYLIVFSDSLAQSYEDLRGKTFAFSDPKSNSGMIVPTYELAKLGATPEKFFKETIFTYAHDRSIHAVAEKMVDGAAVDSLIWKYMAKTEPSLTAKTKIIAKSPPYGSPPFVVSPHIDQKIEQKLKTILLKAHLDPSGQQILKEMNVERFVEIDDSAYDSIREMKCFNDEHLLQR